MLNFLIGIAAALFTFLILCFRMAIDQFVISKNTWSNDYFKYIIQYLIQGNLIGLLFYKLFSY